MPSNVPYFNHRYQPFSRSHCCSVFGKTPFLGTFENKREVFFVFVPDATTVGEPLLLSTSPCHQPTSVTTGTSPSQGATAAVCSVRLHSSVLLRTSVKCFFCLCPGCHHCRGATAAFHFSLPPADQCHHRYQPFSRSHCCGVFGKTPFLGTFENKCEVSLSRMPPL